MWRKTPKDVEVLTLGSGAGVRLFRPTGVTSVAGAAVGSAGGGYVICGRPHRTTRCAAGSPVNSARRSHPVDYRLAPEHPVSRPGRRIATSALQWLARLPSVDPSRVAIGGASAGGGLAAALALLTRDRGEISLTAQLLVYPMLDDRTVDRKGMDNPGLRLWNQASNKYGWSAYLGGADPRVWQCPPGARTSVAAARMAGRRHPSTCFTMKTWPTPSGCQGRRGAVRGRGGRRRIPPASTGSSRKPKCRSRFSSASALCCGGVHPAAPA